VDCGRPEYLTAISSASYVGKTRCKADERKFSTIPTASFDLEVCSADKRIAHHREIDFVRPGRQSRRLEVENISADATQRGVEAEARRVPRPKASSPNLRLSRRSFPLLPLAVSLDTHAES
jgi:hypothetical protein